MGDTIDPLAGSYAIEAMTNEIERRARDYIEKIDSMGGMVRAIEMGYVQKEINESAYRYQLSIENGETVVVGVNEYTLEEDLPMENILKVDPEVEEKQKGRLRDLKKRRDGEAVEKALNRIKEAARNGKNLMPPIIEAVRVYATVGEISDALREVFGEYTEAITI